MHFRPGRRKVIELPPISRYDVFTANLYSAGFAENHRNVSIGGYGFRIRFVINNGPGGWTASEIMSSVEADSLIITRLNAWIMDFWSQNTTLNLE